MWVDDLTKALYFLNATDYRWKLLVRKITDNFIFFTDGSCARVQDLVKAYDNFIRTGEIAEIFWSPFFYLDVLRLIPKFSNYSKFFQSSNFHSRIYHSNSNLEYTVQLRFVKFCAAAPGAANSTSKFFQMSCGSWKILPFSPAAGKSFRQISQI